MSARELGSRVFLSAALVHLDGLYNFALAQVSSPARAEQLVEETYRRALRASAQRGGTRNLKRSMFTILRRASNGSGPATVRGNVPVEDPAHAALERLPEEQRLTVLLFVVEGFAPGEIAKIMDAPRATVSSWLDAAMERLGTAVDREASEQPIRKEA